MQKVDSNKNILDIFRLVATAQVFLGHCITHFAMTSPPVQAVYFVRGVPILFVLCGFLAAMGLQKYQWKDWLVRRAFRIMPGFWAVIAINTVILLLAYSRKPTLMEGGIYFFTQFFGLNFYTGDWLRQYGTGVPNGVLWTIPVQIQFFVLAVPIHKLLSKKKLSAGLAFVGLLTALSILCLRLEGVLPQMVTKLIGVTVLPYLYFLVAGMVGWYHRDAIIPALKKVKWFVLAAYVLWKLAENHLVFPHALDGVMYNTVTTLLMAVLIFSFGFIGKWRMKHDLTYGFYLYHMVFINLAIELGFVSLVPWWSGLLLLCVICVLTILSAYLSQRFVENPAGILMKRK